MLDAQLFEDELACGGVCLEQRRNFGRRRRARFQVGPQLGRLGLESLVDGDVVVFLGELEFSLHGIVLLLGLFELFGLGEKIGVELAELAGLVLLRGRQLLHFGRDPSGVLEVAAAHRELLRSLELRDSGLVLLKILSESRCLGLHLEDGRCQLLHRRRRVCRPLPEVDDLGVARLTVQDPKRVKEEGVLFGELGERFTLDGHDRLVLHGCLELVAGSLEGGRELGTLVSEPGRVLVQPRPGQIEVLLLLVELGFRRLNLLCLSVDLFLLSRQALLGLLNSLLLRGNRLAEVLILSLEPLQLGPELLDAGTDRRLLRQEAVLLLDKGHRLLVRERPKAGHLLVKVLAVKLEVPLLAVQLRLLSVELGPLVRRRRLQFELKGPHLLLLGVHRVLQQHDRLRVDLALLLPQVLLGRKHVHQRRPELLAVARGLDLERQLELCHLVLHGRRQLVVFRCDRGLELHHLFGEQPPVGDRGSQLGVDALEKHRLLPLELVVRLGGHLGLGLGCRDDVA
mmetsp:Transcript_3372/g.8330  ORF Transcript_3372/g.8330 Transcript_3372/m.8330 type:complete len:512 (+) Transcript_3372:2152-3687(+)